MSVVITEFPDNTMQLGPKERQKQMKKQNEAEDEDFKMVSRYFCTECGKMFLYKSKYEQHYVTHTGYKPYVWENCGMSFNRKYNWKMHCHGNRCVKKE